MPALAGWLFNDCVMRRLAFQSISINFIWFHWILVRYSPVFSALVTSGRIMNIKTDLLCTSCVTAGLDILSTRFSRLVFSLLVQRSSSFKSSTSASIFNNFCCKWYSCALELDNWTFNCKHSACSADVDLHKPTEMSKQTNNH